MILAWDAQQVMGICVQRNLRQQNRISQTENRHCKYCALEYTVMAKRIRTICYFIRKKKMRVKRPNKLGKTVILVPGIQYMYK